MSPKVEVSTRDEQVPHIFFIVTIEIMIIHTRASKTIKDIIIGDTEFKISQLTDDTSNCLLDMESVKLWFTTLRWLSHNIRIKS